MGIYEDAVNGTVQICVGDKEGIGNGSGFHLSSEKIVVTNSHVVQPYVERGDKIFARTADGESRELKLIGDEHEQPGPDYAVLEVTESWDTERSTFNAKVEDLNWGRPVIFSGFPLGLHDLLVHEAQVSGFTDDGFYLDGSVNVANSGGPCVDFTGSVIGIITYKGFHSPEKLDYLVDQWISLYQQAQNAPPLDIQGISFTDLARVMAESFDVLENLVRTNASTGIGGVTNIEPADEFVSEYLGED